MVLKALSLLLGLAVLSSCSTLDRWASRNAERRDFQVRKVWVRQGPKEDNVGYRKINRMTPVLAGNLILSGNAIDGLVAMDRDSGEVKWRVPVINGIEGGAALIRDRLFVGGSDGKFYAVDARTGEVLWAFATNAESLGEPFLDGSTGILYVLTAANVVHALDAESGRPVWVYSRQDAAQFNIRGGSKPALKGETLYVGFSDGFLAALNARTGAIRWDVQLNRNKRFKDVDSSAVIDGDRLYVAGYDDKLYSLSTETGEILWTLDRGGYAAVTVDGNRVYYPTSDGALLALDRGSGKILWDFKIKQGIATGVVQQKGLLVFGESRGSVRFLEAGDGREVASFEPGRGVFSTPLVEEASGRVYFISNEANVYALEAGWKRAPAFPYLR